MKQTRPINVTTIPRMDCDVATVTSRTRSLRSEPMLCWISGSTTRLRAPASASAFRRSSAFRFAISCGFMHSFYQTNAWATAGIRNPTARASKRRHLLACRAIICRPAVEALTPHFHACPAHAAGLPAALVNPVMVASIEAEHRPSSPGCPIKHQEFVGLGNDPVELLVRELGNQPARIDALDEKRLGLKDIADPRHRSLDHDRHPDRLV